MCFSVNLPNDQLAAIAVAGMLPTLREKLLGTTFEDLSHLAQTVAELGTQYQSLRRDTRFWKGSTYVDTGNPFIGYSDEAMYDEDDGEDYSDEIAAVEWNWGKKMIVVSNPWVREIGGRYDFDVSKSDKLFGLLLKEGRLKVPANYAPIPPEERKNKAYCKYHNTTTYSTSECRIFKQNIQRAIQQGLLRFEKIDKAKVDASPFSAQNMVDVSMIRGKAKVLTSARA